MDRKITAIGFASIFLLLLLTNASGAVTGVENITLSSRTANVLPGGRVVLDYNLTLVKGYYSFGTNIYVVSNKQLVSQNITVLLTKNFGNPPVNGEAYIEPAPTTLPGTYNITLAGNSTNVLVNPETFILVVSNQQSSSSSTTKSTSTVSIAPTTVTSSIVPKTTFVTTVGQSTATNAQSSKNHYLDYLVAPIIVVVIVIFLILKNSKRKSKTAQPASKKSS